jgi:hypothetical protein
MAVKRRCQEDALKHAAIAAFVGVLAGLAIVAHARMTPVTTRAALERPATGVKGTPPGAGENPRREADLSRSPQSAPAGIRRSAGDK